MVLVLLARGQFGAIAPPTAMIVRADSGMRRMVDVLVAGMSLVGSSVRSCLFSPLPCGSPARGPRSTGVRVGRSGEHFAIMKPARWCPAPTESPAGHQRHGLPRHHDRRLLRATKLDELPQLINVLKGDMTLIGPRPEVPRFIPCYDDDELEILTVRPGLTDPGRSSTRRCSRATVLDSEDPSSTT
jgi:lipopolysaccharide/colanic/teichoic acid biosynthesis glycosyltransferase